jgi:uncharacterized protein (TIGR03437 family)
MSKFLPTHSPAVKLITSIGFIALFLALVTPNETSIDHLDRTQIKERFGNLPLSFEENRGQADASIRFISHVAGYKLYLTNRKALMDWSGARLTLNVIGSKTDSKAEGWNALPGKSNYFIGDDPNNWRTDIPNYSSVRYREVYPGVDLIYYGNQRQLEYDFVVEPRADPAQIGLALDGADKIELDKEGDLLVAVGDQQLRMRKPYVYQDVDGERRQIAGRYLIDRGNLIRFQLGDYDPDHRLIIDPVLDYSTYLGGGGTDVGYGIAVDQAGNVYVTGQTGSLNFPTKNPFDSTLDGASDAFVVKLNATGTALVFATYIGGRNPGDRGWAIAVDKAGNVYFTGETNSLNFPTVNAAQPIFRGNGDAFVAKLNIGGNVLLYSTYLGGSFFDGAYSIALDRFDNAYVTGRTDSANFPIKNAMQPQIRGQRDVFVTRLDADGGMVYSTYLGGEAPTAGDRDEETGYGIALDALQNVYIAGFTNSPTFPTVNAIQPAFGGVEDAFITRLNAADASISYSTFLGGSRVDNARGVAVDSFGNAYITGYTVSLDFPQVNPLQPGYGGNIDAFVAKVNASGSALIYSSYFGGSSAENNGLISENIPSCAIAVDNFGNAYLTGKTESPNLPVINAVQGTFRGVNDAFIAKVDPVGTALIYSTFLGSTFIGDNGFEERGLGIAVSGFGVAYVTGQVLKNDFPIVNAAQKDFGGGLSDAFIVRLSTPDLTTIAPVSAASFYGAAHAAESIVAVFGTGFAAGTQPASGLPLPMTMLGASVTVKDFNGVDRFAPLFFVSPNQINFQMPAGTPEGKATITVTTAQNANLSTTVWVNNVAPALFSANANGQGVPAAFALRVKADGSQSYEPVAQFNNLGQLAPLPIDLGPESDQVYLILFGAGLRNRSSLANVKAQIGGVDAPVFFAGPQGEYVGQDQVNLLIPRSLAGRGETQLILRVDGMIANPVTINVR